MAIACWVKTIKILYWNLIVPQTSLELFHCTEGSLFTKRLTTEN